MKTGQPWEIWNTLTYSIQWHSLLRVFPKFGTEWPLSMTFCHTLQIHNGYLSKIKSVLWNWRQSILIYLTNTGSPSHGKSRTHYWRSWKEVCFQGGTRNFYSTLKLTSNCTCAQWTQTYDNGCNRTCGRCPWCLFHRGARGRMAIFFVACIFVHASYAVLTHSIHFFFLSNICANLLVTDISNRCQIGRAHVWTPVTP